MSGHVSPKTTYYAIFGALMVLTAITVSIAFINLGPLNFPVALAIAILKATLVILFFMHVKYSSHLTKLICGSRILLSDGPVWSDAVRLPVARVVRGSGWDGGGGHARDDRAARAGSRTERADRDRPGAADGPGAVRTVHRQMKLVRS